MQTHAFVPNRVLVKSKNRVQMNIFRSGSPFEQVVSLMGLLLNGKPKTCLAVFHSSKGVPFEENEHTIPNRSSKVLSWSGISLCLQSFEQRRRPARARDAPLRQTWMSRALAEILRNPPLERLQYSPAFDSCWGSNALFSLLFIFVLFACLFVCLFVCSAPTGSRRSEWY